MRSMRALVSGLIVLVAITVTLWQREAARDAPSTPPGATERASRAPANEPSGPETHARGSDPIVDAGDSRLASVGFRNHDRWVEHYRKHGSEFGAITQDEYLRRAQDLRDRPAGGAVLEAVRADGVITRYDRESGAFLAVNSDGTIRTFFRPNQGETYFRRQSARRN